MRLTRELFAHFLIEDAVRREGRNRQNVTRIAHRELSAISEAFSYHESEVKVLGERLGRRFDQGMALNEAANRAIAAKKTAETEGNGLSSNQKAALEFQKQYLDRIVRNS